MIRGMRISVSSLLLSVLLTAFGTAPAAVLAPGAHVADFTLQDETGLAHQLYALSEKKAVVVMTQSNGCPIVRLAVPALREIRDRYRSSRYARCRAARGGGISFRDDRFAGSHTKRRRGVGRQSNRRSVRH
jgi:hypothetical protein